MNAKSMEQRHSNVAYNASITNTAIIAIVLAIENNIMNTWKNARIMLRRMRIM